MTMIDTQLVFNIANTIFLIGTGLLIYAVIKNRNILRGFQPLGSVLTLLAMSFVEFNYWQLITYFNETSLWYSIVSSGVTIAFWVLASVFSIRNTIRSWWEQRKGRLTVYKLIGVKNKKEFEKLCGKDAKIE
jgi:multisubunit Na+/H+ antiporter MnhF subunit